MPTPDGSEGEWFGECTAGTIPRALGRLKDDERVIPHLLKLGDGNGDTDIAYFGEKIVGQFITKANESARIKNQEAAGMPYMGALGILLRFVDSNIPKKYPLSKDSIATIRNIYLEALKSKDYMARGPAVAGLSKIANPSDISLIEKIAKKDPYCDEYISPGPKTIRCPVREDAVEALTSMKEKINKGEGFNPHLSESVTKEVPTKFQSSTTPVPPSSALPFSKKGINFYLILGAGLVVLALALAVEMVKRKNKA